MYVLSYLLNSFYKEEVHLLSTQLWLVVLCGIFTIIFGNIAISIIFDYNVTIK